jgi:ribosomal protein S18 acetylase RimI-like enzyme
MPIIVRDATIADAAIIVDFNRRLAQESEGKTLDPALVRPGVEAMLLDPAKGRYFVAEENGTILGQMAITSEWSDWRNGWFWWIQSVYVRAEARRRGVFRSIFEHIQNAARHDPTVIGLRLYVDDANQAAQATYYRLGLLRTGYFVLERYPLE